VSGRAKSKKVVTLMWVEVPWLHENLNWQLFIRSPYSCSLLQSHLEMILSLV